MKTTMLIAVGIIFSACGSSNFSGGADANKKTVTASNISDGEEPSEKIEPLEKDQIKTGEKIGIIAQEAESILSADGELSEDDKKIVGCIEQWGQADISAAALRGYKKLTVNNEGFASSVIKDTKKTKDARLVFVQAASTGFSGARLELLNPNGWYCVDVKNVGFSSSNLMLHCDSELAGYSAQNKGFANAQETRVGC